MVAKEYRRGVVETYDDRAGYGYIRSDEPETPGERLLVHRRSLRSRDTLLEVGERVLYQIESVARGLLATDVHADSPAMQEDTTDATEEDFLVGTVVRLEANRGFGFIDTEKEKSIFFHFSELAEPGSAPLVGARVQFTIRRTEKGCRADRISYAPAKETGDDRSGAAELATPRQQNLLAMAILARDGKRLDEAAELYKQGMRQSPSVQLITSYVAMEKNRSRRKEAMRIYEQGLKSYPSNLKLCEDAGLLATSMGEYRRALDILEHGLQLSKGSEQGAERLFLLAIARVYSKIEGSSALTKCLEYYHRAKTIFDSSLFGKGSFPKADLLAMNLAAVRLQHYRGNLVYEYVTRARFRILRARLLEQTTVGADFVIGINSAELIESYGIAGNVLVRCMFKADVSLGDIETLEATINDLGTSGLVDDQLALLVVSSLPESVEKFLFRRIEEKRRSAPAIIPLTQSQIETSDDAMTALRQVLDRWLYQIGRAHV